jgi:hypothetical protein
MRKDERPHNATGKRPKNSALYSAVGAKRARAANYRQRDRQRVQLHMPARYSRAHYIVDDDASEAAPDPDRVLKRPCLHYRPRAA